MSGALAIGIDLGGSRLKCALVDGGGRLVRFDVRPAGTGVGGEGPLEAIVAAVADLARSEPGPVVGVGLGVPGAIDPERGALVGSTPHVPGWVDFPVRDTVAPLTSISTVAVGVRPVPLSARRFLSTYTSVMCLTLSEISASISSS